MLILEEKQETERRKAARRVHMERSDAECWSPARKRAEALFEVPECKKS